MTYDLIAVVHDDNFPSHDDQIDLTSVSSFWRDNEQHLPPGRAQGGHINLAQLRLGHMTHILPVFCLDLPKESGSNTFYFRHLDTRHALSATSEEMANRFTVQEMFDHVGMEIFNITFSAMVGICQSGWEFVMVEICFPADMEVQLILTLIE